MSFEDLINDHKPVLIDFYADWCGPCKTLAPVIQELKNEIGDKVRIVKIDIDANQAIANKLQVMSIPTLMIYQNGKQIWRETGLQTKQGLQNILNQFIQTNE